MYIEKLSKEEQDLVSETNYDMLAQAAANATDEADRLWARQLVLAKLELAAMLVSWEELDELAELTGDDLFFVEAVASVKMQIEGDGDTEAVSPAQASDPGESIPDLPVFAREDCDKTAGSEELVINDHSKKWSLIERNQEEVKNHINDHFWSDGHYNDHSGLDVISNESLTSQINRQPGYAVLATNTAASPDGGVPPTPPRANGFSG